MYLAIFIFLLIIIILSLTININVKSVNNIIKIDARIGFIRFVIPHQRLIGNLIENFKIKEENIKDLKNFFAFGKKHIKSIFKHSSLELFYLAKFTKEDLYLNPILNSLYLILSNQIKSYLYNNFKLVNSSKIKLIKDENYDNIDLYICMKTNLISLLTAYMKG